MIICNICGEDKDDEKAMDLDCVCAQCWGPRVIDTDFVPIPAFLLWRQLNRSNEMYKKWPTGWAI